VTGLMATVDCNGIPTYEATPCIRRKVIAHMLRPSEVLEWECGLMGRIGSS